MKAIVYRRYGSAEILRLQSRKANPVENEVLLKVHAASVNPYDWHFMRGTPAPIRILTGLRKPKLTRLGADVAGFVEAVGKNGTRLSRATQCSVPAKVRLRSLHVRLFDAGHKAGFNPFCASRRGSHCRPHRATRASRYSQLRAGQPVLINGAAGGVGTFAVQIANWLGAVVTGVCSTRNIEMVRSIGADDAIDYTLQDLTNLATVRRDLGPGWQSQGAGVATCHDPARHLRSMRRRWTREADHRLPSCSPSNKSSHSLSPKTGWSAGKVNKEIWRSLRICWYPSE